MSLTLGSWNINFNGFEGELNINNIDTRGNVTGRLVTSRDLVTITGLWDNTSRTLTFSTVIVPGEPTPDDPQRWFFKGYLFSTPTDPQPGRDVQWTLAGSFEVLDEQSLEGWHRGNTRRSTFGWFAQISEVS